MKNLKHYFGVTLFILSLCYSVTDTKENTTVADTNNFTHVYNEIKPRITLSEDEELLKKWRNTERNIKTGFSDLVKSIMPLIVRFTEKADLTVSPKCIRSLMKMLYGLKNTEYWAFQMIDSSGKIPNGISNGFLASLGDFDGCLMVDVPGPNSFRGEYCSIFLRPKLPKKKQFQLADETLPLFVNFTKKGTLMHYATSQAHYFYTVAIRTSVCVPSTCSREDIETIVHSVIASTELDLNVTVPSCDVLEPLVFSKSDTVIISILCVIGLLIFVATSLDVYLNVFHKEKRLEAEKSSTALKCLMCFSAYANTLLILKEDKSPHSIRVFHGMKVITMLWIMLNHTYFFLGFNLSVNMRNTREFGREHAFQVIGNAFLSVETFFFISAVLLSYGRMKFAGKNINIPKYIFRRMWRLLPPMMLVIAASMLIPHMGSGPGWKETIVTNTDRCRKSWWRNMIFINNYQNRNENCYTWLWYIAADTQLYIVALFIVAPLKSRPKLGRGLNILFFVAGVVTTFVTHVYYKKFPTMIYAFLHGDDWNYFLDMSHKHSYTHLATCCIGLYVGCILVEKPKIKIPKILNVCAWLGFFTLGLIIVYGVYDWNQGNLPTTGVSALYGATKMVVWSLALGYVTVACFTGNGGVISSILSWSPFVPLSRLTFMAYLIHPLLMLMYIGSTRVPLTIDHRSNAFRFVAYVGISYSFAYLCSLLFEYPFMGLERIMFSKRASSKSPVDQKTENGGIFGKKELKCIDCPVSIIRIKAIDN